MIEFVNGLIIGIIIKTLFTSSKTADLYDEIDKLDNIIKENEKNVK